VQPLLRLVALCAIVAVGGLLVAVASASWSSQAAGGPLTVGAATIAPPTGVNAARDCVRARHDWVALSWTATPSTFADGYEIFRATGAGSPVSIATVSGQSTVTYTDKTVAFTTSYSYTVQASYLGWRSVSSAAAAITTPNNRCR